MLKDVPGDEPAKLGASEELNSQIHLESTVQDNTNEVAHKTSNWFQKSGTDSVNDEVLRPASDAIEGHTDFRRKFRWPSGKKLSNEKISDTKSALEQQIKEHEPGFDAFDDLRQQATAAIDKAADQRAKYENDRKTGGKKIGRYVQKFVKCFADFLSVYSGIVELLKSAGQVYGTVAYETLSIFFVIVVNKVGNDSKIAELLDELRKSFPKLDDWVNIYPTRSIKELVTEVYTQVIARLWMAIGKPPSMGVDRTMAILHGTLAEVNSEAMLLLHKRSQNIHQTVEDNNARIKDLKVSNSELKQLNGVLARSLERLEAQHKKFEEEVELKNQQEDTQRLEIFKEALSLTYPCNEADVAACKRTQLLAFDKLLASHRSPRIEYTHMSPELLATSPTYQKWHASTQSSVLLLSGRTLTEGRNSRGYTHSWLSPAATHVVEEMRSQGHAVAYYCSHPGLRWETHAGKDVVATLAYQMLEWRPEILRRKHQHFRAEVQSETWESRDHAVAVDAVFGLLREVLREVRQLGMVYVVVDRVDLWDWKLHRVMGALAGLAHDEGSCVKIMAVAAEQWDVESEEEKVLDRLELHQGWDQKQLTQREMHRLHSP